MARLASVLTPRADQYVIPGNILYKQRGSVWHPGENCIMGRDHTIHATASGYVKYYRDPSLHPDRKYIGVVFNKNDTLPYPKHAERKRRLNLAAHPIVTRVAEPEVSASGIPTQIVRAASVGADGKARGPPRVLRLRDDYSYREDNWRIGRLVKLDGVTKFKGGRGHTHSRSARFRNKRWRTERQYLGERKAAEKRGEEDVGEQEDEWTMAAQRRKQEERAKRAKAAQDEKRKKADRALKLRLAGMKRAQSKKG